MVLSTLTAEYYLAHIRIFYTALPLRMDIRAFFDTSDSEQHFSRAVGCCCFALVDLGISFQLLRRLD